MNDTQTDWDPAIGEAEVLDESPRRVGVVGRGIGRLVATFVKW